MFKWEVDRPLWTKDIPKEYKNQVDNSIKNQIGNEFKIQDTYIDNTWNITVKTDKWLIYTWIYVTEDWIKYNESNVWSEIEWLDLQKLIKYSQNMISDLNNNRVWKSLSEWNKWWWLVWVFGKVSDTLRKANDK